MAEEDAKKITGKYILTPQDRGKAEHLVTKYGGEIVALPKWPDIPQGKALIIVVDNVVFEAAALIFDKREYERCTLITDMRPKKYVLMDKETAYRLAGYKPTEKVA